MIIGIRREDKNEWEKRTPLIPGHIKQLQDKFGITTIVQPSDLRCFSDNQYSSVGAILDDNLEMAKTVFAIKEIPAQLLIAGKVYVFFSHTIKGQDTNISLLKKLSALKCTLIDYEKIVDDEGRRMIFFGRFAGIAGMIETLHVFGQKLKAKGLRTPFENIKQPYQYGSIESARQHIKTISEEIKKSGLPAGLTPIITAFTGYGNVSKGAQEIFDLLPHKIIPTEMLTQLHDSLTLDTSNLYKVIFTEEEMMMRKSGFFNRKEYFELPEMYESKFEHFLPYISILVNCIYWSEKYPRLITREYLKNIYTSGSRKKLQVIGDISCDLNGSIQITYKTTKPDLPSFTYLYDGDKFDDRILPDGIAVVAIDNLPCEFPNESSTAFSEALLDFIPDIAKADYSVPFDELDLPQRIKNAVILYQGNLTDGYKYLNKFIKTEKV